jgi:hypothetical protein
MREAVGYWQFVMRIKAVTIEGVSIYYEGARFRWRAPSQ